jgi:hypothetical protein
MAVSLILKNACVWSGTSEEESMDDQIFMRGGSASPELKKTLRLNNNVPVKTSLSANFQDACAYIHSLAIRASAERESE